MGSSRSRSRLRPRARSKTTTPPVTPSSSIDSSSDPPSFSSSPSSSPPRPCNDHQELRSGHPDTDLRLGLGGGGGGTSASSSQDNSVPRVAACWEQRQDWPPIKPLLRSALAGRWSSDGGSGGRLPCLFVKVYMEGVLIGRKLNLLAHQDYDDLVSTLARMFKTKIHGPGECAAEDGPEKKLYVLTYEDKDGDWMMVGDVPWEMFKSSAKRLMITRADKC